MSPELSQRLAMVLLILEDQHEHSEYLSFRDRIMTAISFTDLTPEDQSLVLRAEKRLRRTTRTGVQETKSFKVTEPHDFIETKELRLSTVYNYRRGGINGEIVAKRVVHFADDTKTVIVGREIRDV